MGSTKAEGVAALAPVVQVEAGGERFVSLSLFFFLIYYNLN